MVTRSTRGNTTAAGSAPDNELHHPGPPRPRWRRAAALLLTVSLLGGCGGEGDEDLSPVEPEAGENDTEVVPGEEGPVD